MNPIGYDKYDRESSANTSNSRNGYNSKQVNTSLGKVQVDIPRDREGQFEPIVVPKYSRDISDIEDKIISMYERGMTLSEIKAHFEEIYGLTFSASQISRITDRVFGEIDNWKNRPLQKCYLFVFMNAIHFNIKSNKKVSNRAAYAVLRIDLEEKRYFNYHNGRE